jgi:hypothetical protein
MIKWVYEILFWLQLIAVVTVALEILDRLKDM